jgi:microcystin-dependent protein
MSEPFLGEIRPYSFPFAPRGWALCNGQLLSISQNTALYSILGTTYGGDGRTTFALPDLRGRASVHVGDGVTLGELSGEEAHTLTMTEMPSHNHLAKGNSDGSSSRAATANVWGQATANPYGTQATSTMSPSALAMNGGGQSHSNMQPYNVVNYCIALEGIFPSRD